MKIAILDDDPELLESVSRLLNEAGHSCFCFDRGEALIQTLRRSHFDLFVLDWNLPDRSGISVIEWIRNRIGDSVPVLLLTSRSLEEDVIAGLEAGADDFISKPVDPDELHARLKTGERIVRLEQTLASQVKELQIAAEHVRELQGMIPICMHCKKIRDDSGYWNQVEVYVRNHTEAEFSHGLCPD